jgi:hypothetical protein
MGRRLDDRGGLERQLWDGSTAAGECARATGEWRPGGGHRLLIGYHSARCEVSGVAEQEKQG